MKTIISVTLTDWGKFNPRTDSKNHTWFRFENTFFTKTFSWSAEEQRLFQYLCCLCSQEKKNTINVDLTLASALLKRKPSQIIDDLDSLEVRGIITQSNKELPQVTPSSLVPTNVRTNERTPCLDVKDFEKAWDLYGNKVDRGDAEDRFKLLIKTKEDLELLLLAIPKYKTDCTRKNRQLKHFTTFIGTKENQRWREWITPESQPKQLFDFQDKYA